MAKPIIPLEARTKAIELVLGGIRGSRPLNGSAWGLSLQGCVSDNTRGCGGIFGCMKTKLTHPDHCGKVARAGTAHRNRGGDRLRERLDHARRANGICATLRQKLVQPAPQGHR